MSNEFILFDATIESCPINFCDWLETVMYHIYPENMQVDLYEKNDLAGMLSLAGDYIKPDEDINTYIFNFSGLLVWAKDDGFFKKDIGCVAYFRIFEMKKDNLHISCFIVQEYPQLLNLFKKLIAEIQFVWGNQSTFQLRSYYMNEEHVDNLKKDYGSENSEINGNDTHGLSEQVFRKYVFKGAPYEFAQFLENLSMGIEAQGFGKIIYSKKRASELDSQITQVIFVFIPFFTKSVYTPNSKYEFQNVGIIRATKKGNNQSEVDVIVLNNSFKSYLFGIDYLIWIELQRLDWIDKTSNTHLLGNEEISNALPSFLKTLVFSGEIKTPLDLIINNFVTNKKNIIDPLKNITIKKVCDEKSEKYNFFGIMNLNEQILFGFIEKRDGKTQGYCLINIFWAFNFFDKLSQELGLKAELPKEYMELKSGKLVRKYESDNSAGERNLQQKQSRDILHEGNSNRPKWWPKTDAKKYKYRHQYSKIKPLYDIGKNYSQIAEELGIDRHEVSHILTWFQKSPEAYGK